MAFAMFMRWSGITPDQYDAVMTRLELDANPAAGQILHTAEITDEGLRVFDVWQTEQAFHGFLEQRLMPIVEQLQLPGRPQIEAVPLYNIYVADADMLDRIGAISVPAGIASWST
jgi:hypothetical protein